MNFDHVRLSLNSSRSLVFLFDCCLCNTLDSEVNFEAPSLPRAPRVPPYWNHADENRRVEPARLPSEKCWVVDAEHMKLSDAESLSFFCHPFNTVGWHKVAKDNAIGSSLPEF